MRIILLALLLGGCQYTYNISDHGIMLGSDEGGTTTLAEPTEVGDVKGANSVIKGADTDVTKTEDKE